MKIQKLLKQFGAYGNEYSLEEVGDRVNEIIDALQSLEVIEPEEVRAEEVKIKSVETAKVLDVKITDAKGGYVARSPSTGDMVYYIEGKVKRWVKNPETLTKLGFGFTDVVEIGNDKMDELDTGDSLDLTVEEGATAPEKKDGFDKYNI